VGLEAPGAPHRELANRLRGVPKEVGVILLGIGVVGVAVPGPIPPGLPVVLLGTCILCPSIVSLLGRLARTFPRLFQVLSRFIERLMLDLERRYPAPVRA
jgi:hypothetical protein